MQLQPEQVSDVRVHGKTGFLTSPLKSPHKEKQRISSPKLIYKGSSIAPYILQGEHNFFVFLQSNHFPLYNHFVPKLDYNAIFVKLDPIFCFKKMLLNFNL